MILRPYGIVIDGYLELGVELVIEEGVILEVRPHTGIPELFIVSPAFVNAHSHLEYRGMMGKITEPDYPSWIREITRLKKLQTSDEILGDCRLAAKENIATGVAYVLEHSDRPYAGQAMKESGLDGWIFQEVITFNEHQSPKEKIRMVEERARMNAEGLNQSDRTTVSLNPHAYQTVDRDTLSYLASLGTPLSIHVAETDHENEFTRHGSGPIADFYKANGVPFEPTGKSVVASIDDLGLISNRTQLVHCCAIEESDIEIINNRNAAVAHCPRSNKRLQCPPAPIRELLDAGIRVGLGLDSAASGGPIDMFEEMRAALLSSSDRGRKITADDVWQMATNDSYFGPVCPPNDSFEPPAKPRLIKIHLQDAVDTGDIIEHAHPGLVEWV